MACSSADTLSLGEIVIDYSHHSLGLIGDITNAMLDCQEINVSPGEPSSIFLIRFGDEPDYAEIVRRVSVALDRWGRNPGDFGFICVGENYQPFAFAYFSDSAGGDWQNAELTVFSWIGTKTVVHTGAKHELPDVFFPEPPSSESESEHEDSRGYKSAENFDETEADYEEEVVPPDDSDNRSGDNRVPPPTPEGLLAELKNSGKPLSMRWTIRGGVTSGYDEAFTIDVRTHDELIAADDKSRELMAPLLQLDGKWRAKSDSAYMIWIPRSGIKQWPWSDVDEDNEAVAKQIFAATYPAISEHLDPHKKGLKARQNKGKFYWEYPSGKLHKLPEQPKIVYPHRGVSMRAGYELSGALPFGGLQFIATENLFLLAILNSKLFDWYARATYQVPDKPRILSFKQGNLKNFPIPPRTEAQESALADYVQLILDEPDSHEVSALEEEINALVYALYGLTDAEIALIEGN